MENKSLEQLHEDIIRQIVSQRNKIIDDFFKAYAAQISYLKKESSDLDLSEICLVEQVLDGLNRKYWFEYRPKFID